MGRNKMYCAGCFSVNEDGGESKPCPVCGYHKGEARSQMVLPVGVELNNQYKVGNLLGVGGFGITYLGWDIRLLKRVAIKEFFPRKEVSRESDRVSVVAETRDRESFDYGLKTFLSEARTVAGFDHPNIVRVRTYFEQHGTAYMVLDYYEGTSLTEYVKQAGGRLMEKPALDIMRFVMDGLRHVHGKGCLHRDVKPDNIYLTNRGQVILLDFGAARYAMNAQSRGYSIIGTKGYMPFEQYQRKGHQGPWTDIYACGATLYELLTGKRPPDAPDRTGHDELVAPTRLAPGISAGVNDAVVLALRMEIRDRPQDIQQYMKLFRTEPAPGEEWVDHVTGMVFVWVPGGYYMMGCGDWDGEGDDDDDDEKPVHEVCVDGFWMGQTAVTQGQWQRVMGSNPSSFKEGDNYPVEQVSWEDAKEYIRKLNGMGNAKFRLPSEAEWEYAARSGGKAEKYSGGSDLDSVAWYSSNSGYSTHPVRTKKGNGLGIYDMSGNVWEWCEDVYIADIYSRSDKKNPIYNSGGPRRVGRGGSWGNGPDYVRCAYRDGSDPAFRYFSLGFRLLRMP